MFNKDDIIVFKKEAMKKEARDVKLPDHLLSYDHESLNGHVRSVSQREDDEFTSRLKNISRGR